MTTRVVTFVNYSVALVKAQDMGGVIRGSEGTRAKVGERFRVRIVDFDAGGSRFIAERTGY